MSLPCCSLVLLIDSAVRLSRYPGPGGESADSGKGRRLPPLSGRHFGPGLGFFPFGGGKASVSAEGKHGRKCFAGKRGNQRTHPCLRPETLLSGVPIPYRVREPARG